MKNASGDVGKKTDNGRIPILVRSHRVSAQDTQQSAVTPLILNSPNSTMRNVCVVAIDVLLAARSPHLHPTVHFEAATPTPYAER